MNTEGISSNNNRKHFLDTTEANDRESKRSKVETVAMVRISGKRNEKRPREVEENRFEEMSEPSALKRAKVTIIAKQIIQPNRNIQPLSEENHPRGRKRLLDKEEEANTNSQKIQKTHLSWSKANISFLPKNVMLHVLACLPSENGNNFEQFNQTLLVSKQWKKLTDEARVRWINSHHDINLYNLGLKSYEDVFEFVVKNGKRIRSLNLRSPFKFWDELYLLKKQQLKGKQLIFLKGQELKRLIYYCSNLKSLYIYSYRFDDEALGLNRDRLTTLQRLSLTNCDKITDAGLVHLKDLSALQRLSLNGCDKITDGGLVHIKDLSALQRLSLANCDKIMDVGLVHIKDLSALQRLSLWGCNKITDVGLVHLKDLSSLQRLSLNGCDKITDVGLVHLKDLSALQRLSLNGCNKITDVGLVHLKDLSALQRLSLWGCGKITDAGLVHLKDLSALQWLSLGRCGKITDAGLVNLKDLSALQWLFLLRCDKITDACLVHLKDFSVILRRRRLSYVEKLFDRGPNINAFLANKLGIKYLYLSS